MLQIWRMRSLEKRVKFRKGKDGFKVDDKERAIINIGAENFDAIFSSFCYKGGDMLSPELRNYIDNKVDYVPIDYDLTLRFHVKNATEAKRSEIRDAVKENYETEIRVINRRMQTNTNFSLLFFVIGSLILLSYLWTVNYAPVIIKSFLELFSWVFMWQALDAYFLDRRVLQGERLKKYRIISAKIEIVEFEPY